MSPEQASADPSVDHRADIYALGVVAYELLTGQPPFAGRTPQHLLAAHVTEAPEAITRRRASLPPALAALVMRCLEKRPADRPQSASEVVHALDDITTPSERMTPRRWGAIAAAVALVIVIASWLLATRTGGAAKLRSIAVLPTDIGADTAHAFLADGLSSDLTTKLSTIPGLSVRAYAPLSVMHGRTVREAGKELGVGAIVMVRMARSWDASPRDRVARQCRDRRPPLVGGVRGERPGPVRASGHARLGHCARAQPLAVARDHHGRAGARHEQQRSARTGPTRAARDRPVHGRLAPFRHPARRSRDRARLDLRRRVGRAGRRVGLHGRRLRVGGDGGSASTARGR